MLENSNNRACLKFAVGILLKFELALGIQSYSTHQIIILSGLIKKL